jgi:hypothetical protein
MRPVRLAVLVQRTTFIQIFIVAITNIRTSFLERLKHTANFPVCCVFVSRCFAALRTMEIPPLLYRFLVVSSPYCSQSDLLCDRFTANHFVLATSPLSLTTSNFIFQLNTCCCSPYVTSSQTRGWIFRLKLLLVLTSEVILRSESRMTHDHIFYCLKFETPPTWRPGPRIYIHQEQDGPVISPGTESFCCICGWSTLCSLGRGLKEITFFYSSVIV